LAENQMMKIAAVGLDADDTLWHNEDHFHATEDAFADVVRPWADAESAASELLRTETANLSLFGYGVKSFTLSMIEAAITISRGEIGADDLAALVQRGKDMLDRPASMLPGVVDTLEELAENYPLLLITKGDLHHQHRKVEESGLSRWFQAVEVVREKDAETYGGLLRRYDIAPSEFVMVGNSVKSDVLPAVALGAVGVHIPYAFTWAHEAIDPAHLSAHTRNTDGASFWELEAFIELPGLLRRLTG
jgi:putative hydrolase of the HAD superfamily